DPLALIPPYAAGESVMPRDAKLAQAAVDLMMAAEDVSGVLDDVRADGWGEGEEGRHAKERHAEVALLAVVRAAKTVREALAAGDYRTGPEDDPVIRDD